MKKITILYFILIAWQLQAQQRSFKASNNYVAPVVAAAVAANALDFDGTDDIMLTTNDAKFQTNTGTLEGWIKTSNAGAGYCGAFGKTFACMFYLLNNELIIYDWVAGANRTTGIRLDDNTWHHIAVSYNAGVTNGTLIYIDGVLKLTTNLSIYNQNQPFTIGSNNYGQPFKGSIDDVRVWNVVRTQAQIQDNMNAELSGTETGLVAYYTFNQGVAAGNNTAITTITDKTANALNGTLTNLAKTGAASNFVVGKVAGTSATVTNGLVLNVDAGNTASYPGTGTTWTDLSGSSNTGTLVNGVGFSAANSGSLIFDGSNDYISIPNSATLQVADVFTVNMWINAASLANRCGIFTTRNANSSGCWQLETGIASGGTGRIAVTGIGTWIWESSNNVIQINNWYNLCFVKPGNGLQGLMYVNGNLLTPAVTTNGYIISNNNDAKEIGRGTVGTSQYFSGQISKTALYNRALSATEVSQNYNATKSRYGL